MRIRAAGMWTSGMAEATGPVVLTVEGDRLTAIQPGDQEADVHIDAVAVPGLVDCHEHIGIDVGDERSQSLDDAPRMAIRGVEALRTMLHAGVTTIRDCGERADVEPYWIEALDRGVIRGPRVVRSVTPICRTGGHAWYLGNQVDGVDQALRAVRRNVRDGADFIKVMATGGMGTVGSVMNSAEFTVPELQAIVGEAHRLGRKVAAHAHGGTGVDHALDAGVDSIEHGVLLTRAQLERMAELGTYLVVTMGIAEAFSVGADLPPSVRQNSLDTLAGYRDRLEIARATGVPIALGSDCVHGGVAAEAGFMVRAGYPPVEALDAATRSGARLIGLDDVGVLEPGRAADVLFVAGDPTHDISRLSQVVNVLANGEWVTAPSPVQVTVAE